MQYKTENTWKESYHDEHIALGRTYVIGNTMRKGLEETRRQEQRLVSSMKSYIFR